LAGTIRQQAGSYKDKDKDKDKPERPDGAWLVF
jgi:hypothetical protein